MMSILIAMKATRCCFLVDTVNMYSDCDEECTYFCCRREMGRMKTVTVRRAMTMVMKMRMRLTSTETPWFT